MENKKSYITYQELIKRVEKQMSYEIAALVKNAFQDCDKITLDYIFLTDKIDEHLKEFEGDKWVIMETYCDEPETANYFKAYARLITRLSSIIGDLLNGR